MARKKPVGIPAFVVDVYRVKEQITCVQLHGLVSRSSREATNEALETVQRYLESTGKVGVVGLPKSYARELVADEYKLVVRRLDGQPMTDQEAWGVGMELTRLVALLGYRAA